VKSTPVWNFGQFQLREEKVVAADGDVERLGLRCGVGRRGRVSVICAFWPFCDFSEVSFD